MIVCVRIKRCIYVRRGGCLYHKVIMIVILDGRTRFNIVDEVKVEPLIDDEDYWVQRRQRRRGEQ